MNRRMYFMLPDVATARQVRKEMLLARIEDRRIGCLVKPETPLGDLPLANLIERTDLVNEGTRGVFVGAALGLLAGGFALLFPPEYFPRWYAEIHGTGILALTTFVGILIGGIGMGLMGMNLPNSDLEAFEERIANGEVLMMVVAPFHRVREIRRIITRLHPTAAYAGAWPTEHTVFP